MQHFVARPAGKKPDPAIIKALTTAHRQQIDTER
jgi:hypothetical protein